MLRYTIQKTIIWSHKKTSICIQTDALTVPADPGINDCQDDGFRRKVLR